MALTSKLVRMVKNLCFRVFTVQGGFFLREDGWFLCNSVRNLFSAFPLAFCFTQCQSHITCPHNSLPCPQEWWNQKASLLTLRLGTELGHLQADIRAKGYSVFIGHTQCTLFIPHCTTFPILFNNLIYIFLSSFLAAGYAACKMARECYRWAD